MNYYFTPNHRKYLILFNIIFCFIIPLLFAISLILIQWHPINSSQHGELLNPINIPYKPNYLFNSALNNKHWTILVFSNLKEINNKNYQNILHNLQQIKLALGRDIERVEILLLLDKIPEKQLLNTLSTNYPKISIGIEDQENQVSLLRTDKYFYLLDPLSNLVMRYQMNLSEFSGLLKDIQHLLKWSKIG